MFRRRRGSWIWILAGLALLVSSSAAVWVICMRALHAELAQARGTMEARRFGRARDRLSRLSRYWTNQGEVFVLIGECELELHRREEALAAWDLVAPGSPFFGRAAVLRGTHLINSGRYAPAEELLLQALGRPDPAVHYELERTLTRLYRFEGRFDDVRRLVRASWCRSPNPASSLKELWTLDHSPMPVESWNRVLEAADADDDRVWLGRASQAILTGRFADAANWLDRCIKRRPDDPSVWQARLELAEATGEAAGCRTALDHLPAERFDNEAIRKIRASMAASVGDAGRERHELLALLEGAPGNTHALERLAVLLFQAGQPGEAEKLHRRKAEIDRAQDRYRKMLFDGDDLSARADVLAQLSVTLGRPFDAAAWGIIEAARLRDPGPAQGGSRQPQRSPLPESLIARAVALSSPFAIIRQGKATAAPMLGELVADLRPAPAAHGLGAATASRAVASPDDPSKSIPEFVDDAEAVGLRFVFDNGQTAERLLPETMSGGLAQLDFDGDGWLDVYCVQGGVLIAGDDEPDKTAPSPGDHLFHNRGDGTFEDVSQASGIAQIAWGRGYGMGVTAADYDNDGRTDLFVTRLSAYSLYRNRGDGTFEDVTVRAGLAGRRDNPTSAAFADLDNDGDLDLYVCHYMIWDPAHPRLCKNEKSEYFYCDPSKVEPAPDRVFRNDGGRFVDVTASSGCAETDGRGLGVVAADIDDDNLIDLYVANDGTANYLFRNLGNFHFEEIGLRAGVAGSADGGYQAGMGVACGDLDGDGRPELMVTNFYGEGTTLYENMGQGLFTDRSAASGIGLATRYLLGFGIAMVDVTNHGRKDVIIVNGHVNDNRPFYLYAMPSRLYENRPDGRLVDVSNQAGPPWDVPRVGRGLSIGDVDNDGRVDAVIVAQNEPIAYFHNRTRRPGHSVTFRLEGTRSNRDGVGARVTVTAGGRRQVLERCGGGSYQSASDPRLHFGLGESKRIEQVEIRWPSGQVDRHAGLDADSGYLLREGDVKPHSLREMTRRSKAAGQRPIP
jgi:enediyne biosynthesis protein E4